MTRDFLVQLNLTGILIFSARKESLRISKNTETIGVNCYKIDNTLISHLYSDYIGGFPGIIHQCNKPALCLPYSLAKTQGQQGREYILENLNKAKPHVSDVIQQKEFVKIGENVYSTGMFEEQAYEQWKNLNAGAYSAHGHSESRAAVYG